mgnify:CR=1 FL=1
MKKLVSLLLLFATSLIINAQQVFKGDFQNKDLKIRLKINLYEEMPILDDEYQGDICYGRLSGALNGSWYLMKIVNMDDNKAIVRAVSDSGIEAQTLEMTFEDNSIIVRQTGDTNIRGVKNSKYFKLPKKIVLTKN